MSRTLRDSGRPLDSAARATLEPRFGHDFSRVRVHTDERAAESAQAVGALAYTVGQDIVFDRDRYAPASPEGQHLLAHELAHVIQQGSARPPDGPIRIGEPNGPGEAEAHTAAVTGGRAPSGPAASGVLQRAPSNRRAGMPWSAPDFITAGISDITETWYSERTAADYYEGSDGSDRPFSQIYPGKLCAGIPVPIFFGFRMDTYYTPRPGTFTQSRAAVTINFLNDKGRTIPVKSGTSACQHTSPGNLTLNSLDPRIRFTPPGPGRLLISLVHSDTTSGAVAVYSDEIPVEDCPEEKPEKNDSHETHYVAVVPDPVNNPDGYHILTLQDGLDEPGLIIPVEQDKWGYFYRIQDRKQYIEDPKLTSGNPGSSPKAGPGAAAPPRGPGQP